MSDHRALALFPALALILILGLTAPTAAQQEATHPSPATWEQKLVRAKELTTTGAIPEAIELARDALAEAEQQLVSDEDLLSPLLFLATLQIMDGDLDAAEPHSVRANEIAEARLGQARTTVATTLKYLGAIYSQRGDLDAAQGVYERALEISEEAVGPDHPETAKHVGNLAALLLQRDQPDEAEALFRRSLAIWDAQSAPNPVYTVGDLCNLAELRLMQERPDEALALYAKGVSIQEAVFGEDDPRLHNTLLGYATALRKAGRSDQADVIEERVSGP